MDGSNFFKRLSNQKDSFINVVLGLLLICILGIMVLPIPSIVLNILIGLNLIFSLILVCISFRIKRAMEFSALPSILLFLTLFRLSLNISVTRLILMDASNFDVNFVRLFANFAMESNLNVGTVTMSLLLIVHLMVIDKLVNRLCEVGARFTLDALPSKQMSIESDLNAGLIDEDQAKSRRETLQREIDFYGAMDGASKFVKGESISSILLMLVTFVGGFIICFMTTASDNILQAIKVYAYLGGGSALMFVIPSILMSISTSTVMVLMFSDNDFDVPEGL